MNTLIAQQDDLNLDLKSVWGVIHVLVHFGR